MSESPIEPGADPEGAPTEDPELTPPADPDNTQPGFEPSVTNPDSDGTSGGGSDDGEDEAVN